MSRKVDEKGNYKTFPGFTVVASAVNETTRDFLEAFYDELQSQPIISQHYALLPMESYHMTTLNLITRDARSDVEWRNFVQDKLPWFQSLHARLVQDQFRPKVLFDRIVMNGTIMIFLKLDAAQNDSIHAVANDFSIQYATQAVYHITLGYQYAPIPESIQPDLVDAVHNALDKHIGREMELEPPKLCYFNDMTAFIPWTGTMDPFNPHSSS